MTADATKPREQRLGYKNAADGLFRMIREEGPSSLARGIVPNTVRCRQLCTLANSPDPCHSHERELVSRPR
jgi:hypothetical protein